MTIEIKQFDVDTEQLQAYGFQAWNVDGRSLPKGMYSSYVAYYQVQSQRCYIEFSMQSPTGDSSDHHNFTFPCLNFEQAMSIVDMHSAMMKPWVSQDSWKNYQYAQTL